jgi:hypothetical protein
MTLEDALAFAEYLSYRYTTVRVDGRYMHKRNGHNYLIKEVLDEWLKNK